MESSFCALEGRSADVFRVRGCEVAVTLFLSCLDAHSSIRICGLWYYNSLEGQKVYIDWPSLHYGAHSRPSHCRNS